MSTDSENTVAAPGLPLTDRVSHWVSSLIGTGFNHVLDGIDDGELVLSWPNGQLTAHGKRSSDPSRNAHVTLNNYRALGQLMRSGEVGFAESYLRGDWSVDNLVNFFELIMRNEEAISHALAGGPFARISNTLNHWLNRNSRRGSERNISFHYDLGNAFYQTWLDSSMSYSSAIYEHAGQSLEDAQTHKLDRVAQHLGARPGARVLEIGCGWGALGHHLAKHAGLHVEGVSLSKEQLAWADQFNRVPAEGSGGSTRFAYKDYRDVVGTYDHIVSIEMFEAVGEKYWRTYFDKLAELLDSGGTAVLQVITILEDRFEEYRSHPDFIQRYIFPGGMLPTKTHLAQLAEQAGFDLVKTNWFGNSYARTLAAWRDRFEAVVDDVSAQGFDQRFLNMWRYYLGYCEAGFSFGRTDVGMLVLSKR